LGTSKGVLAGVKSRDWESDNLADYLRILYGVNTFEIVVEPGSTPPARLRESGLRPVVGDVPDLRPQTATDGKSGKFVFFISLALSLLKTESARAKPVQPGCSVVAVGAKALDRCHL
jgi:hypothetical protein